MGGLGDRLGTNKKGTCVKENLWERNYEGFSEEAAGSCVRRGKMI